VVEKVPALCHLFGGFPANGTRGVYQRVVVVQVDLALVEGGKSRVHPVLDLLVEQLLVRCPLFQLLGNELLVPVLRIPQHDHLD